MRRTAFLALMSCSVVAVPVAAKSDRARTELTDVAEGAMRSMAACVAKQHRSEAIQVLATDPTAPNANVPLVKLLNANCGNGTTVSFHMQGEVLRGTVAEQLYLQSYKTPPADLRPEPLPGVVPGEATLTRYAVAACAAARNPMASDALLRAGRRTPQEREAGGTLAPTLNACAKGHVDFSGAQLHGALAEALFKLRSAGARGLN